MLSHAPELNSRHLNNFGALRLVFAVLVILSHSPVLVDGDGSREILLRIFGTISLGEIGVDGFFLISGYLITKSFMGSSTYGEYFLKRVLRIYPGYVVAYLLCVFALGPFVGVRIAELSDGTVLREIVSLSMPGVQGVFPGSPYPALNGSMWTIAYEFRCYLLVMVAGIIGLLSRRSVVAFLTISALVLSAAHPKILSHIPAGLKLFVGEPDILITFSGVFGCGALHYLYRDRIRYDWRLAVLAALGMIALMFWSVTAEAAFAIFGGYIVFWFAFNVHSPSLAAIGRKVDISYGVYLYAWPVQKLLIWWNPAISPWWVFTGATVIASLLALGSWRLVEKPFLGLKTAFVPRRRGGIQL
jgi:peptidoglycan/LPS O-acetylase OafA/YrhL